METKTKKGFGVSRRSSEAIGLTSMASMALATFLSLEGLEGPSVVAKAVV